MRLVHYDQAVLYRGQPATARRLVSRDDDRCAELPRGGPPLLAERGRDQAHRRLWAADSLRDGERDVGLAATDRIREQRGTMLPDGEERPPEAPDLLRAQPPRCRVGSLVGGETPGHGPRYLVRWEPRAWTERGHHRIRNRRERFSHDPRNRARVKRGGPIAVLR